MTPDKSGMNRIQKKGRKPKPNKDADKARFMHYIEGVDKKVVAMRFPKVSDRQVYRWLEGKRK